MIKEQTLSWTIAQTEARLRTYRWLFGTSIAVNLLIGLWCLFAPASFAGMLHQPNDAWLRVFGATWVGLNLVYLPGLTNPLFYRWSNWSNIAINLLVGIVLLGSGHGLRPAAIWPLAVGVILIVAYYRLVVADVQSKP